MHRRALAGWMGAALGALTGAVHAQSCHPLDGRWMYVPAESRVGAGLAFSPHDAISAIDLSIGTSAGQINQRWAFHGPHIDRTAQYELLMDDVRRPTRLESPKDFEYSAVAAQWQNCTLIVHGYSSLFGLEIATSDTYVVSEDGQRLSILRYGESPVSITDQRLEFIKQNSAGN
jgi:hypothetical protein